MSLPIDLRLALAAAAGVDLDLPDGARDPAIRAAVADRRGYVDGPIVGDTGFNVELLRPERMTVTSRTDT